jgi:hypothetical protein
MVVFSEQKFGQIEVTNGVFSGNGDFVIRQFLIDFEFL